MASRIYQRARALACAATWAACAAGCASASDAPLQSPSAAGGGGGNESAGAESALGGKAAAGAGIGGADNIGGAGAAGAAGSNVGSGTAGATSNGDSGASNGGPSSHAGGSAIAGANSAIAGANSAAGASNLPALSVYIAGDSTVSDYAIAQDPKSQAGWGQMLGPNYTSKVKVLNKAVGGRTARRFIQEGSLSAILKLIQPGDYLLVQFGTNDSNSTAKYTLEGVEYPYFADAQTDFKTYLQQYIDGAHEKKAIPVLVTPPPRNSAYCKGPRSLGNYGQAMLELGKAANVPVVDLGLKTHAHLSAICPKPTTAAEESFFKVNADQSIDGTHFQQNGARIMAAFVADGVDEAQLGLSAYRKP